MVCTWHADDYPHEEMFLHDLDDGILRPLLPFLSPGTPTLPAVTWVDRPPPDGSLEVHLAKDTSSKPPMTIAGGNNAQLLHDRKRQLRAEASARATLRKNARLETRLPSH